MLSSNSKECIHIWESMWQHRTMFSDFVPFYPRACPCSHIPTAYCFDCLKYYKSKAVFSDRTALDGAYLGKQFIGTAVVYHLSQKLSFCQYFCFGYLLSFLWKQKCPWCFKKTKRVWFLVLNLVFWENIITIFIHSQIFCHWWMILSKVLLHSDWNVVIVIIYWQSFFIVCPDISDMVKEPHSLSSLWDVLFDTVFVSTAVPFKIIIFDAAIYELLVYCNNFLQWEHQCFAAYMMEGSCEDGRCTIRE